MTDDPVLVMVLVLVLVLVFVLVFVSVLAPIQKTMMVENKTNG